MVLGAKLIPNPVADLNPRIVQLSTIREAPARKRIPFRPVPTPSISSPFNSTWSVAPALTTMPLVPETSTPAVPASQEMVMALVIVTPPNPPGSRQLISPPAAVLEIAPAKVLQGAVRLHGLTSSPTPETQVRVAWAWAGADARNGRKNPVRTASSAIRRMFRLQLSC